MGTQKSIFDVSQATRDKLASAFAPTTTLGGALAAFGNASAGMASGRPITPGTDSIQTPLAPPAPASVNPGQVQAEPETTPVQREPSVFEQANEQLQDLARRQQAALAQINMGGGGYTPKKLGLPQEIQQAADLATGAVTDELGATQRYLKQVAPLEQARTQEIQAGRAAEQGRMTRLEDLGRQQQELSKEMAGKVESFRVDPNRLFGQGGQRAGTEFGLGIASILSNVGEAMQGKAATNQILGLVQRRIEQDISLQENDYRRMLQGFDVRRNGLMDAVQQVGNERVGAEALAKQQAAVYADQLGTLARTVGLRDAQAARPLLEAQARILQGLGQEKGRVEQFNVAAENQARATAAAAAQRAASARAAALSAGIGEGESKTIGDVMKKAEEKGLFVRTQGLNDITKVLTKYPNAAMEARGVLGGFYRLMASEKDPGVITSALESLSRENLSEGAREYVSAYQRFIGPRVRALAGANVTAGERFLYDPERATSPKAVSALLDGERNAVKNEAEQLERSAGFERGSVPRLYLRRSLAEMYETAPAELPDLQRATATGKALP